MKRGRNQRRRQGVNPNRALDSNGPDVRIRGTANQIYDKYQALARDASSSGDRVKAESYLQHAEHYFRLIRSMQATQQPQHQPGMHESDSDQPMIDDGDNDSRESNRPHASHANGAEDAGDDDESDVEAAAPERSSDNGSDDEDKKPRRRRAPRRAGPKRDDQADASPKEAAAAE